MIQSFHNDYFDYSTACSVDRPERPTYSSLAFSLPIGSTDGGGERSPSMDAFAGACLLRLLDKAHVCQVRLMSLKLRNQVWA